MRIYADNAATTQMDRRVFDAMVPFLTDMFHNPSSLYAGGQAVRQAIEASRSLIADYLGCESDEIFFTSGGTEAANLALFGSARRFNGKNRIVVGATEHHAVGHAAKALEAEGFTVVTVPCDRYGYISPDVLESNMTDDTGLVSVMWVNNETGMIQPAGELCAVAHKHGALFHTDAVQALGSQRIRLDEVCADMLSVSSHKVYGPKGCGALFIRSGTPVAPLFFGGSQEKEVRSGTENPAAIAGFGKAVELLSFEREQRATLLGSIARRFIEGIADIPDVLCNSPPDAAVPGVVSLSIAGVDSEPLLLHLGLAGVDASMGAACNTHIVEPSYVLKAMGIPEEYIKGSARFSFGKDNTPEQADLAAAALTSTVSKLRKMTNNN